MSTDNVNAQAASELAHHAAVPIPTGTLKLEKYEGSEPPTSCVISLYTGILEYDSDGRIASACNIKKPLLFTLNGAPSALTLRFVGGSCYDSDDTPKTFRFELKTTKAVSTTTLLSINDILRSAATADEDPNRGDGVIAPGLRTLSVYRATETGPSFDYADKMSCIHIYRSGE